MDNYDKIGHIIPQVKKRYTTVVSESLQKLDERLQYQQRQDFSKPADILQASQIFRPEVKKSLILKKTINKLLFEQFSILNLTKHQALNRHFATKVKNKKKSLPKNNTVIKILVEPITRETQTSKAFLKRKHIKNLQKTVSNTDYNCIHDKSYLSRAKKHPIYDLKETSSADVFKSKEDKNARRYSKKELSSLTHITYTKQILNSLSMDQKGRKDKPNRFINDELVSPRSPRNGKIIERCTCIDTNNTSINKVFDDMNSPKNRVTIVGRLGINENDQYVLNCAATVNEKPIETQIQQQKIFPESTAPFENITRKSKTTKATQANTCTCFVKDMVKNTVISNKTVQSTDIATTVSYCEFNKPVDLTTERKSPLIVISVYPTPEVMEDVKCLGDLIQIQTCPQSGKMNCIPTKQNQILKTSLDERKNRKLSTNIRKSVTKPLRSRSPSPAAKHKTKEKIENIRLDQKNIKTLKSQSPDRQLPRNKMITKNDRSKNKSIIVNYAQTSKVNALRNGPEKLHESNIEKRKIKKAIVNEYTQNLLKPISANESKVKITRMRTKQNDTSNVTINIDGDNERYRVLFLQDNLNTDLSIRKTLKSQDTKALPNFKGKDIKYNIINNSIEKTVNLARETKRGKQKNFTNQKQDNINACDAGGVDKSISGLKIRDSLDISHWRESNSQYKPIVQLINKKNVMNPKISAVDDKGSFVKHYRGDKCCVPSPVTRDQEIRELLGIKKHRAEKINIPQDSLPQYKCQTRQYYLRTGECKENSSSPTHRSTDSCYKNKGNKKDKSKLVTNSTQYDQNIVQSNSHQQMVLSRNIQVFLQVDQFTKQKPIILSRSQYEKVKKTIQKKVSNRTISQGRYKRYNPKSYGVMSFGEVRKSRRQQTFNERMNNINTLQSKHSTSIQQNIYQESDRNCKGNKPPRLLYSTENDNEDENNFNAGRRQTVSSMEIRYASMAHMKHVTFSSSNFKSNTPPESLLSDFAKKSSPSIQTIFKGHKKSVTPNLGTSAYSLYSDKEMARFKNKNTVYSHNEKPKKPFLKRLVSCLVMRSAKMPEAKMPPVPQREAREPSSLINSFDSYHLSTSFGGIDMTSSLYDTSASFYSNHTILPITNMKRGFFSSVRGFLSNLKGR